MITCNKCGKPQEYCACDEPDWEDEEGFKYGYDESINQKVNRKIKNGGKFKDEDKGGFLGSGFDYCPGDPFW